MLLLRQGPDKQGGLVSTGEATPVSSEGQPSGQPQLTAAEIYTGPGASSAQRVDIEFNRGRLYGVLGLDDITPIYEPEFVPANEASFHDDTFVIGLAIDGEARAYPINILSFHEMVNDVVGGVPVLVTW